MPNASEQPQSASKGSSHVKASPDLAQRAYRLLMERGNRSMATYGFLQRPVGRFWRICPKTYLGFEFLDGMSWNQQERSA